MIGHVGDDAVEVLNETTVASSSVVGDIEVDGAKMQGSLKPMIVSSDESLAYYAYDSSDGMFVRIGKNASVKPFRAIIAIPSSTTGAKQLVVSHGDNTTTGIHEANLTTGDEDDFYDLAGRKVNNKIVTSKSIYISKGKKVIK